MGTLRGIVRFLWWPTCLPTIRRRDATPQNREQHTGTVYAVLQEALKKMPSNEFTRVCLVRCILRECPGTFPSIRFGDTRVPTRVYSGVPRYLPEYTQGAPGYLPDYTSRRYTGTYPSTLRGIRVLTRVFSGGTRVSSRVYYGVPGYLPEYTPGIPGHLPE